jgi:hypothetical protein
MNQMSEISNKQNKEKLENNKDSDNNPNSSKQKIIINNSQNNCTINNENLNIQIDEQKLNIIIKELENIAITGKTKYSWEELKPYVIYFYQKNVKFFPINKKSSVDFGYLHNSGLSFPFGDKKESKDEQMDFNNSNEHIFPEDKNLNLIGDFHLNDENHLDDEIIKINNENNKSNGEEDIGKDILEFINKINLMPFTIQRIAELLLEPKKYYSSLLKYNRAFYKLVNIDFD